MKIPYNILIQIKMSVRPYFKGFTLIFFFYNCRKQDHIYGSLTLDFVQCINDFFKLFSLNLHTVSIDNHPASVEIFLCQLTQFLFPDTEVF